MGTGQQLVMSVCSCRRGTRATLVSDQTILSILQCHVQSGYLKMNYQLAMKNRSEL